MNEPFEEMAIFARIAEKGSFTAAAKSLGRSKAFVSQQLTKLEELLGIQLLFRTTRQLSLTEAGKVYLEYCQDIIRSAAAAKRSIAALQGEMTGSISISATNSFGEIIVSDVLSRFQEKYPDIRIDLDLSDEIRDLKTNDIDISIRGGSVVDDDLVAIPLVKWQAARSSPPHAVAVASSLPLESTTRSTRNRVPLRLSRTSLLVNGSPV